jgi:hypothetical protein
LKFPATGGFGERALDWRHIAARSADGKLLTWELAAGEFTITLKNTDNGGLNLDYIALASVE